MASDWTMPKQADACVACGRTFEIGESFTAYLHDTPTGYERRDFCGACPAPEAERAVGFWRAHRNSPRPHKAQAIDREAILAFFERLGGAAEPEKVQFRFVLALLLWRKRVLKLDTTDNDGAVEFWVFHEVRTGRSHRIARPPLDEPQLDRLSAQLESLLTGGDPQAEALIGAPPPGSTDA